MQMYSLFDVESITLSPVRGISETPDPTYYCKIQVKHKDGIALITFYSNDKESLKIIEENIS